MFSNMFGSSGDDKPVSDVSTNVATPAVDQSDAWTAYKTERGPVFYYNAVTGISTCEKPVGCEGKVLSRYFMMIKNPLILFFFLQNRRNKIFLNIQLF